MEREYLELLNEVKKILDKAQNLVDEGKEEMEDEKMIIEIKEVTDKAWSLVVESVEKNGDSLQTREFCSLFHSLDNICEVFHIYDILAEGVKMEDEYLEINYKREFELESLILDQQFELKILRNAMESIIDLTKEGVEKTKDSKDLQVLFFKIFRNARKATKT